MHGNHTISPPLFDENDECDLENDEQQIIYFPSESYVQQKIISCTMKEISLCMTVMKKILGHVMKEIRRGYWSS
jgi:hypothetical protein